MHDAYEGSRPLGGPLLTAYHNGSPFAYLVASFVVAMLAKALAHLSVLFSFISPAPILAPAFLFFPTLHAHVTHVQSFTNTFVRGGVLSESVSSLSIFRSPPFHGVPQSGYFLLHQIPDYLGGTCILVKIVHFLVLIDSSVTATPELHTRSQLSVVFPLVVIFRL